MADRRTQQQDSGSGEFEERVVNIKRCSKVVKGGRNFSFSALVVVGNRAGKVGVGLGKANEVTDAIRKGGEMARKSLHHIPLNGTTITHEIRLKYRGADVMMRPAAPGTGLIAGGGMRAVLDLAGVRDVLAKSLGSSNPTNAVKATMQALQNLHSRKEIMERRGVETL